MPWLIMPGPIMPGPGCATAPPARPNATTNAAGAANLETRIELSPLRLFP